MKSFGVPHYHLITREGYEVWTYADNERGALRRRASAFYEEGIKPIILTCHTDATCRLYRPDHKGLLHRSKINARLDTVRDLAGCLQGSDRSANPQHTTSRTSGSGQDDVRFLAR